MGKMPKIYITGMGGSGTTFTFHLFYNAGWQTEDPSLPIPQFGGPSGTYGTLRGMEWLPFRAIAEAIGNHMGRPQGKVFWTTYPTEKVEHLIKRYAGVVKALRYPDVIKCPDFGQHILFGHFRPLHTIVMVRTLRERAEKAKELYGIGEIDEIALGTAAGTGMIIHALEAAELPYTVVHFPKVVQDEGYAYHKLADLVGREKFLPAYRKTVVPRK